MLPIQVAPGLQEDFLRNRYVFSSTTYKKAYIRKPQAFEPWDLVG